MQETKKSKVGIIICSIILVISMAVAIASTLMKKTDETYPEDLLGADQGIIVDESGSTPVYVEFTNAEVTPLRSYEEYQELDFDGYDMVRLYDGDEGLHYGELTEDNFEDYYYIAVSYPQSGNETFMNLSYEASKSSLSIYYVFTYGCGYSEEIEQRMDLIRVKKGELYQDNVDVYYYFDPYVQVDCEPLVEDKPMIYIYPEEEMDLSVYVGHPENLTTTYPAYADGWNVHVTPDGNIHDYATDRDYYGLYWEGLDYTAKQVEQDEGFVVAGKDSAKFLEEKLVYLGLNNREINEFIVYWLPQLEASPYNLISFRDTAELNRIMPLEFSTEPDTLIRVLMDFWPLEEAIEVKPQTLKPASRSGFSVIEWGGTRH